MPAVGSTVDVTRDGLIASAREIAAQSHLAEDEVRPGDVFVLTSDGVHGAVEEAQGIVPKHK